MTAADSGHPFSLSFASVAERLESTLRLGVETPRTQSFRFGEAAATHALREAPVAITRVTGLAGAIFRVFEPDADYWRPDPQTLAWRTAGTAPDKGTIFDIEYTVREPSAGITDLNPGSVAGTLVRAVARELTQIYAQMDEAYRRGFIDVATGHALDNVVALLGVVRHAPQPARGRVTFTGKPRANIPKGTRVADAGGRIFVTLEEASIPAPAAAPADPKTKPEPPSVAVEIEAAEPGPDGNVNSGTIVAMPKPPADITGVCNDAATAGGREAEDDERLRGRAKQALEGAARGTLGAIRSAVLAVPGVEDCAVADHGLDDSIPLGEVHVRYVGAGTTLGAEVAAAVERSRAAGIRAVVQASPTLRVAGVFYLLPSGQGAPEPAAAYFLRRVADFLRSLPVGAPLVSARVNALAFEFPALAGVAQAALTFVRSDGESGKVTEPFQTRSFETVAPDPDHLGYRLLTRLRSTPGTPGKGILRLDLQLGEPSDELTNFSLAVQVVVRAFSKAAKDAAPERIATVPETLVFNGKPPRASLELTAGELQGFVPGKHREEVEVLVTAPAYPALESASVTLPYTP